MVTLAGRRCRSRPIANAGHKPALQPVVSWVAHVSVGAEAGREPMPITPEWKSVSCTSVAAGDSNIAHVSISACSGREDIRIPRDCESAPFNGVAACGFDIPHVLPTPAARRYRYRLIANACHALVWHPVIPI